MCVINSVYTAIKTQTSVIRSCGVTCAVRAEDFTESQNVRGWKGPLWVI